MRRQHPFGECCGVFDCFGKSWEDLSELCYIKLSFTGHVKKMIDNIQGFVLPLRIWKKGKRSDEESTFYVVLQRKFRS